MASEGFKSSQWYVTDLNLSLQFHHHGLVILAIVIIFIILFISFLLCNFLHQCNQIVSTNGSGINPGSGEVPVAVHSQNNKGLDEATINSLPSFLHSSLCNSAGAGFEEISSECSICLCSFEENEMVKVIPRCLHLYHSECVDKWLQNRAICPLCRAPLHSPTALEVEPSSA